MDTLPDSFYEDAENCMCGRDGSRYGPKKKRIGAGVDIVFQTLMRLSASPKGMGTHSPPAKSGTARPRAFAIFPYRIKRFITPIRGFRHFIWHSVCGLSPPNATFSRRMQREAGESCDYFKEAGEQFVFVVEESLSDHRRIPYSLRVVRVGRVASAVNFDSVS